MELSTRTEVLAPLKVYTRLMVMFFFVMLALPYFYNLGSSEIGCPVYEWRTGEACYRILN